MGRTSGKDQPSWQESVEFLTDDPSTGDGQAGDTPARGPRVGAIAAPDHRWYRVAVFVVAAGAVLLGLFDVPSHSYVDVAGNPPLAPPAVGASRAFSSSSSLPSQQASLRRCPGADCPNSDVPEAGIIAAFAAHVPGVTVASDHTITGPDNRGRRTLVRRVLRMAFGDVNMTVTITQVGAQEPMTQPHALVRRLTHGEFVFVISTIGLYPPTHHQLQALVADPRLISIQS